MHPCLGFLYPAGKKHLFSVLFKGTVLCESPSRLEKSEGRCRARKQLKSIYSVTAGDRAVFVKSGMSGRADCGKGLQRVSRPKN